MSADDLMPGIKSIESKEPAFLIIGNLTNRIINMYWVDYESKLILYKTLDPMTGTTLDTYKTHPWVFRDSSTNERMHVNHTEIFFPETSTTNHNQRARVLVHFPVRTLKENALWKIAQLVKNEQDINQLEIPAFLLVHKITETGQMEIEEDGSNYGEIPELISEDTNDPVYITFLNKTNRVVSVFWVNFNSKLILYDTLNPDDELHMDTYIKHPWIFRDYNTWESMQVANEDVYWPQPNQMSDDEVIRTLIEIHFPMRSLRENSLWSVTKLINDVNGIDDLQLPIILINQLKLRYRLKSRILR